MMQPACCRLHRCSLHAADRIREIPASPCISCVCQSQDGAGSGDRRCLPVPGRGRERPRIMVRLRIAAPRIMVRTMTDHDPEPRGQPRSRSQRMIRGSASQRAPTDREAVTTPCGGSERGVSWTSAPPPPRPSPTPPGCWAAVTAPRSCPARPCCPSSARARGEHATPYGRCRHRRGRRGSVLRRWPGASRAKVSWSRRACVAARPGSQEGPQGCTVAGRLLGEGVALLAGRWTLEGCAPCLAASCCLLKLISCRTDS